MSGSGKSSRSGKGGKVGEWGGELVYDFGQFTSFHLTQDFLSGKMCEFEGIDEFERLQKMWLFKSPLYKEQFTQVLMNHQFVVMQTIHWFWSIEKLADRILLQQNVSSCWVREYREGIRRNKPVVEIKHGTCRGSVRDLIEFLYCRNELNKPYHLLEDNCKNFANRVFDKFVLESSVVRSWHFWWHWHF